jgi:hypothetical protein
VGQQSIWLLGENPNNSKTFVTCREMPGSKTTPHNWMAQLQIKLWNFFKAKEAL